MHSGFSHRLIYFIHFLLKHLDFKMWTALPNIVKPQKHPSAVCVTTIHVFKSSFSVTESVLLILNGLCPAQMLQSYHDDCNTHAHIQVMCLFCLCTNNDVCGHSWNSPTLEFSVTRFSLLSWTSPAHTSYKNISSIGEVVVQ